MEVAQTYKTSCRYVTYSKILITGDSLLHRLNIRKLKVEDIPSEKYVKKGGRLSGTLLVVETF